ncbi:MAG: hypothetical protein ACYDGY_07270 [Acidimicrobiales bacterium]
MAKSRRKARIVFVLLTMLGIAVVVNSFPLRSLSSQQAGIASMSARLNEIKATNKVLTSEVAQLRNPGVAKQLAIRYLGLNPSSSSVNRAPVLSGTPDGHLIHSVPLSTPPVLPGSPLSNALLGLPGAGGSSELPGYGNGNGNGNGSPSRSTSSSGSGSSASSAGSSVASSGGATTGGSSMASSAGRPSGKGRQGEFQRFLHRLLSALEFWR